MSALSSSPFSLGSVPGASAGGNPFAGAGGGGAGSAFGGATPYGFSIPQGDVGELDSAAAKAAGASLGFSSRAGDVTSAIGSATAGWEGAAESAFVSYAGHLKAVLNSNSEVLGRAFTALSSFARELEHAQQVTKQAAAQCERYHGEIQTQQGLVDLHGGNAQTLYAQAAAAAHPQMQGDLLKQAHSEAGLAHQAQGALTKAQGEFDSWQKRGVDADTTYTTQADSAARQIAGLAGELRAPAALPGGSAPVPISVSASDMNFAKSMLPAIQAMPSSAWGDDPGPQLSRLNGGQPLTPSQILAVYDEVKAQQANGKGSIIDGLGGFVNTATGGLVSFGDSHTSRYQGGELAAMIPIDPDSLAVDADRGVAMAVGDGTEAVRATDATRATEDLSGEVPAQGKSFASGRPPHEAQVTVTRDGQTVTDQVLTSGGMTPEERELGFPRSSLATHTESRAVRNIPLEPGDTMVIKGEYPPCPSCKGAMNQAARNSGAAIRYEWPGGSWVAGGGK